MISTILASVEVQFIHDEIERHRANVRSLGLLLPEKLSDFFPALSKLDSEERHKLVQEHLTALDAPKTWTRESLSEYDYRGTSTPFENIVTHWGRPLSFDEREWINELNRVEMKLKRKYLESLSKDLNIEISTEIYSELTLIETVADIADTKWHRVAELDASQHGFQSFAAHEFFSRLRQPVFANLALQLEIHVMQRPTLCPLLF